jgi:hypothetical protein
VTVPWDAESFAKAAVAHHIPADIPLSPALADSKLMSKFPTPELGSFEEPTTLVDCCGRILIWYLPGVLDLAANVRKFTYLNACSYMGASTGYHYGSYKGD